MIWFEDLQLTTALGKKKQDSANQWKETDKIRQSWQQAKWQKLVKTIEWRHTK
jgi:hypothetical protein